MNWNKRTNKVHMQFLVMKINLPKKMKMLKYNIFDINRSKYASKWNLNIGNCYKNPNNTSTLDIINIIQLLIKTISNVNE